MSDLYLQHRIPPRYMIAAGPGVTVAGEDQQVGIAPAVALVVGLVTSALPGILEAVQKAQRRRLYRIRQRQIQRGTGHPTEAPTAKIAGAEMSVQFGADGLWREIPDGADFGADVYDLDGQEFGRRPPPPGYLAYRHRRARPLPPQPRPGVRVRPAAPPPRPHRRGQRGRVRGQLPFWIVQIIRRLLMIPGNQALLLRLIQASDGSGRNAIGIDNGDGSATDLGYDVEDLIDDANDSTTFGEDAAMFPQLYGADAGSFDFQTLQTAATLGADVEQTTKAAEAGDSAAIAALGGKVAALEAAIQALQSAGYMNDAGVRSALSSMVIAAARARAIARNGTGQTGAGQQLYNAAGEPGVAMNNKRPMLAAGAALPRNVFTIPVGGTTATVVLFSELVTFQIVQVVGFLAHEFNTQANGSECFVEDLATPGSGPLFSHTGPTQASTYDTTMDNLVPLRNKPDLSQIEQATVSTFASGTNGDILTLRCELVTRVVYDSSFGSRHSRSAR